MGQDGYRWPNGRVCSGHPVRTEAVDDLVWESVKTLLLNPETVIEEYRRRQKTCKSDYQAVIKQKQNEIKRYQREKDRLIELYQTGLVEKNEIENKLKAVRSKSKQLFDEIAFFDNQEKETKKLLTIINSLEDFTDKIGKNLDTLTFEEKRTIVKFLIEEVEIDTMKEEINVKHGFYRFYKIICVNGCLKSYQYFCQCSENGPRPARRSSVGKTVGNSHFIIPETSLQISQQTY